MQITTLLRAVLSSFGIATDGTIPETLSEDLIGTNLDVLPERGATCSHICHGSMQNAKIDIPCADLKDALTHSAAEAQVESKQLTQLFYSEFFSFFADTLLSGTPHPVFQP